MFTKIAMKGENGSLMIEAVVAASLVVVGILGILALLVRSIHADTTGTDKLIATYLAAEGVEYAKNQIDADYVAYSESNGTSGQFGSSFPCQNYVVVDIPYPHLGCDNGGARQIYELPPSGAYTQDPETVSNSPGATPTVFQREITIKPSGSAIAVASRVQWTQDGGAASVTISDQFTCWRYPSSQCR